MPTISVRDNENSRLKIDIKKKKKNKDRKEQGGTDATVKGWELNDFVVCAFKLGFLLLICNASLIFKSNLELAMLQWSADV